MGGLIREGLLYKNPAYCSILVQAVKSPKKTEAILLPLEYRI
jgi:hypothetical protein